MDKYNKEKTANQTRCDYLFFGQDEGMDDAWVIPMELKNTKPRASTILRQVQAGADAADQIAPTDSTFTFVPAVFTNGLKKSEHLKCKDKRITFRGQREHIRFGGCGGCLMDVLKQKGH